MNKALESDFLSLTREKKAYIMSALGFGKKQAREGMKDYDRRFLSFVENEGKVRTLENLIVS